MTENHYNSSAEERDMKLPSGTVHVEITGQGTKPLILMHGWGCNHSTVRSIAATAGETHKVYNIDFPGFGDSPEPPETWGVDDYTRVIEELVRTEGLDNPVLVGHSFGGRVGILYASRNPVEKLILVDSAGIRPNRSLKQRLKVARFKAAKQLVRLLYSEEKAASKIEAMRAKKGSADYAAASPKMRGVLSRVVNEDLREVLPLIKAPTLLIWGSADTATPLRDAQMMERMIPGAGLVVFEGCGHYSFLDNPNQFKAVLSSFLKS